MNKWILIAKVRGLNYWLQRHSSGGYLLTGLKDNALKFESERGANKVKLLFQQEMGITFEAIQSN